MVPTTTAVNCCVSFLATVAVAGLTVTLVTVGVVPPPDGAGTVTDAVPLFVVSTVEVALTINVVGF